MHISDRVAMKCLNIWLTRIRKTYPEFKYIWVAERQKKNKDNQTIHFHLVTNQYMKIKTVNWWMAKSIDNCVKDGLCSWGKGSLGMYNGVDVRPIYNKAGVDMYLKKYCSKNDDEFQVRPWGCCRMVSALFTVVNVTQEWFEKMRDRGWIKNEVDGVKKYIEGVGWKYYNWAVERSGISKKTGKIWKAVVTPKSVRDKIRWINDQVESFYGNIIYAESRAALAI
jgi:hypothetical protein